MIVSELNLTGFFYRLCEVIADSGDTQYVFESLYNLSLKEWLWPTPGSQVHLRLPDSNTSLTVKLPKSMHRGLHSEQIRAREKFCQTPEVQARHSTEEVSGEPSTNDDSGG